MTEEEWVGCTNPQMMLEFLRGKASDRKLRLFAVACCLRIWTSLKQEEFRNAVRTAELFADDLVTKEELVRTREKALSVFVRLSGEDDSGPASALSAAGIPAPKKSFWERLLDTFDDPWWEDEFDKSDPHAPAVVSARNAARTAAHVKRERPSDPTTKIAEEQEQAYIVHDIFGNPFRPVEFDPAWRTLNVAAIAQTIYEERRFADLPVLADALEEAGCTSEDILSHLRSGSEHVPGCWALDLVLGKE